GPRSASAEPFSAPSLGANNAVGSCSPGLLTLSQSTAWNDRVWCSNGPATGNHVRTFRAAVRRGALVRISTVLISQSFAVQRFGSALQSNVHFHVLVPDGVFAETEEDAPAEFRELPPPSDKDVANLLAQAARRLTRLLERRGRLEQHPAPTDALELLKGASVQARLPLPHGEASWAPPRKRRCATQHGFSLHANVRVRANDRQGLEQLCLYAARGAISLESLEQRPDGKLSYRMRRPAPDGSTHLVLTPLALLKKLAALIPPPRVHQVRGVRPRGAPAPIGNSLGEAGTSSPPRA